MDAQVFIVSDSRVLTTKHSIILPPLRLREHHKREAHSRETA